MLNKIIKNILASLVISLITLALFLLAIIFLTKARLLNNFPSALSMIRQIYTDSRDIVQFNNNCSQYDARLYYKLKPGECDFKNIEFSTKLFINKHGLRDDEESLIKPEIIVLGDSHAMGFGVEQQQTFANLLEKNLATKVLNAGISSYGSAREFLMLQDLDKKALKYLVIQYCNNDYSENKEFVDNNFSLKISSKASYEALSRENLSLIHI